MKKFQEVQKLVEQRRKKVERSTTKVIRKRWLQFLGHMMRSEEMECLVLTVKNRSKGRQKQKSMTRQKYDCTSSKFNEGGGVIIWQRSFMT